MRKSYAILILMAAGVFMVAQAFAGGMEKATMKHGSLFRAAEIVGSNAEDRHGNYLGKVEDLVFGADGNITYLILASGGFLGVGGRLIPVPWSSADVNVSESVSFASVSDVVRIDVSQEDLANAPSFGRDEWDNFAKSDFKQKVHAYYEEKHSGKQMMEKSMPPSTEMGTEYFY
jgi:hypothetical protein